LKGYRYAEKLQRPTSNRRLYGGRFACPTREPEWLPYNGA
jgi:hypothetical protein